MKLTAKEALAVRCPTCGASPAKSANLAQVCHEQNRIETVV